jgi:hypothetical protein
MAQVKYLAILEPKLMRYQRSSTLAMLVSGCQSLNGLDLGLEMQVEISKLLNSMHHDAATNPRDRPLFVGLGDA